MNLGIDPDDLEYCDKHDINYVAGEQCITCNPWQHKKPAIGQKVEFTDRRLVFKGVISSDTNDYGWYAVDVGGKYFGQLKECELKPLKESNDE